jgi:acyl-CoA synthetase (AMP-forming)/AMP-acid ligase II
VSLEAIEAKALQISGVKEVAAVAIATSWGESVGLVYVGEPDVDFAVLEQLSVAAKPHQVLCVETLPRLVSGKADLVAIAKLLSE